MNDPKITTDINHLQENFEDFFEQSLCGFAITDPKGNIIRVNIKVAAWTGYSTDELKGKRFSDLLTIGGKIYYETHLWPLLRMQGFFDEVVLELSGASGQHLRVMVNAIERRAKYDKPCFIRFTILKASDRLQYEQNLQQAKAIAEQEALKQKEMVTLREQLIAVLGHDLRNPLSAIAMSAELLESIVEKKNKGILATLKRSSTRMTELVKNIMDFARTRLGDGIIIIPRSTLLQPVLQHVVTELRIVYPGRNIVSEFDLPEPVNCDSPRIAQLTSNLIANALTHGDHNTPVYVRAFQRDDMLELSVSNWGTPIAEDLREQLFSPLTREAVRPSQNGLGLGLYICSEIARAHKATLAFISTAEETRFIFRMHL